MRTSFKISEKLHYALLVATALGAVQPRKQWLTLTQIARLFRLSAGYLEEVATALRRGGLIVGRRGVDGGYRLSKSAKEITYADVVEAVEGPANLLNCEACFLHRECTTEPLLSELEFLVYDYLRNKTLFESVKQFPQMEQLSKHHLQPPYAKLTRHS